MATCTICNGSGECPNCAGTGDGKWNAYPAEHTINTDTGEVDCAICGGDGVCVQCGGSGDDGEDE